MCFVFPTSEQNRTTDYRTTDYRTTELQNYRLRHCFYQIAQTLQHALILAPIVEHKKLQTSALRPATSALSGTGMSKVRVIYLLLFVCLFVCSNILSISTGKTLLA